MHISETLQDLLLNDLLPPDRKLRLFGQQPLKDLNNITSGNESKRKQLLMLWFFENQLKLGYRELVISLNQVAHDSVDANKEKAISVMAKLLEGHPEQESVSADYGLYIKYFLLYIYIFFRIYNALS